MEGVDFRKQALETWSKAQSARLFPEQAAQSGLSVVSGDASFRRYFRLPLAEFNVIAVDAPPDKENSHPFVAIARALKAHDVAVPTVLAVDFEQGFMLLEDFGDALLRPALETGTVDLLYNSAMDTLVHLLQCREVPDYSLPLYDEKRLNDEMRLLPDWFIREYLKISLSAEQEALLQHAFNLINGEVRQQPQVFVHRDYHSRNLMLLKDGDIGVIDFQDAVIGPITYDLVSLLRDAYVVWPPESVTLWVSQFRDKLRSQQLLNDSISPAEFQRWFDWMGAQRHLKVVGIFARLSLRDGKHGYLNDIPLVFNYLLEEISPYPELAALQALLIDTLLPAYLQKEPAASVVLGHWLEN